MNSYFFLGMEAELVPTIIKMAEKLKSVSIHRASDVKTKSPAPKTSKMTTPGTEVTTPHESRLSETTQ